MRATLSVRALIVATAIMNHNLFAEETPKTYNFLDQQTQQAIKEYVEFEKSQKIPDEPWAKSPPFYSPKLSEDEQKLYSQIQNTVAPLPANCSLSKGSQVKLMSEQHGCVNCQIEITPHVDELFRNRGALMTEGVVYSTNKLTPQQPESGLESPSFPFIATSIYINKEAKDVPIDQEAANTFVSKTSKFLASENIDDTIKVLQNASGQSPQSKAVIQAMLNLANAIKKAGNAALPDNAQELSQLRALIPQFTEASLSQFYSDFFKSYMASVFVDHIKRESPELAFAAEKMRDQLQTVPNREIWSIESWSTAYRNHVWSKNILKHLCETKVNSLGAIIGGYHIYSLKDKLDMSLKESGVSVLPLDFGGKYLNMPFEQRCEAADNCIRQQRTNSH